MKTKNLPIFILFLILIMTTLSACTSKNTPSTSDYSKITAKEAKDMMDKDSTLTILDVRTEEEFNTGHIPGAILIPDTDILEKAEETLTEICYHPGILPQWSQKCPCRCRSYPTWLLQSI